MVTKKTILASYDALLAEVGEFGPYQRLVVGLMLFIGIPGAFNTMSVVLIAASPDHWCSTPELDRFNLTDNQVRNASIPWMYKDEVKKYQRCRRYARDYDNITDLSLYNFNRHETATQDCSDGWDYDNTYFETTVVTKFDLVCAKSVLVPTIASVFMAGLMVGVIVFGIAADVFGRRPVFALSLFLTAVCSVLVAFSTSYAMFIAIRFFIGCFNIAMFTTGFVIAVEFVGPKWRTFVGTAYEYSWAIGTMLLALIGYLVRDWKTVQLITCAPMLLCFIIPFLIPESPRWLYTKNRHSEADVIMEKMANKNKIPWDHCIQVEEHASGTHSYPWHLLKTPRMRMRTMNICYNWFVNSFVYYGLSLNTSNLGGNPYLTLFLSGAVEFPAYIASQASLGRLGCKRPLIFCLVFSSIALLCILVVPEEYTSITITLAMLGKFFISASFAIVYVYTAELCPTTLRNTGVSTGSFFARVGGIVAPYVAALVTTNRVIPYVIFGAAGIIAGGLALLLPETFRKDLPETIQEAEQFGSDEKQIANSKVDPIN